MGHKGGLLPSVMDYSNVAFLTPSPLGFFLLFCALSSSLMTFILYKKNKWNFSRPALSISVIVLFIYQWPLVFLATGIEKTLNNPWPMAISVFLFQSFCLFWVWVTPKLTPQQVKKISPEISDFTFVVIAAITAVLMLTYLITVPVNCTGFWAYVFDPNMGQLAREVSIKLLGSRPATYAVAALTNVFVPVLSAIIYAKLLRAVSIRARMQVIIYSFAIAVMVLFLLLPATKGLLIPTAIMLCAASLFWVKRLWAKIVVTSSILVIFLLSITAFEPLSQRNAVIYRYDFWACAQEINSLDSAKELINSISTTGGFGLTSEEVINIATENNDNSEYLPTNYSNQENNNGPTLESSTTTVFSAADYLIAIFNRAFFVPAQIGTLHYKFVEDFGSPGLDAAPLATRFSANPINVPNLVFDEYIAKHSSTNQGGNSPTSSVISWTAYFGIFGFIFSLLFIITLDLIFSLSMRKIRTSVYPIVLGLLFIMVYMLVNSDFGTAILTHGGLPTIGLLIFMIYSEKST